MTITIMILMKSVQDVLGALSEHCLAKISYLFSYGNPLRHDFKLPPTFLYLNEIAAGVLTLPKFDLYQNVYTGCFRNRSY